MILGAALDHPLVSLIYLTDAALLETGFVFYFRHVAGLIIIGMSVGLWYDPIRTGGWGRKRFQHVE